MINTVVVNSATADPVANNSAVAVVTVQDLPDPSVAPQPEQDGDIVHGHRGRDRHLQPRRRQRRTAARRQRDASGSGTCGTQVDDDGVSTLPSPVNSAPQRRLQPGTIPVGGSAAVTLVLAVDAGFDGDVLVNQAQVTADQTEADMTDNLASATVAVTRAADLAITKTDLNDPVRAGETILYQITVENRGPSDAADAHRRRSACGDNLRLLVPAQCRDNAGDPLRSGRRGRRGAGLRLPGAAHQRHAGRRFVDLQHGNGEQSHRSQRSQRHRRHYGGADAAGRGRSAP
ncbi:MAG: hypothetical protein R2856_06795 [Caldilineaceae bacterium]